jgi:hypothetical protein
MVLSSGNAQVRMGRLEPFFKSRDRVSFLHCEADVVEGIDKAVFAKGVDLEAGSEAGLGRDGLPRKVDRDPEARGRIRGEVSN